MSIGPHLQLTASQEREIASMMRQLHQFCYLQADARGIRSSSSKSSIKRCAVYAPASGQAGQHLRVVVEAHTYKQLPVGCLASSTAQDWHLHIEEQGESGERVLLGMNHRRC
jgi:hypothetical protein